MNFICKKCETELKIGEAVERYNPEKVVEICYCPNKECSLFDETIEVAELIDEDY
jgi:hypothetical protein